jgi:hypothetical protein
VHSLRAAKRLLTFECRRPRKEAQAVAVRAPVRLPSHAVRTSRRYFGRRNARSSDLQQPDKLRPRCCWAIEQFYQDAKGECGLSDYQGGRWDVLHRHLALSMLAYSFLMLHSIVSGAETSPYSGEAFPLGQARDVTGHPQEGDDAVAGRPGAMVDRNRSDQDLLSS